MRCRNSGIINQDSPGHAARHLVRGLMRHGVQREVRRTGPIERPK